MSYKFEYLQTIVRLMELLRKDGVQVDERRFKSSQGIDGLSEPFVGIVFIRYCYWINSFSIYRILNTEYI